MSLQTRTRVRVDLVISHLPAKIGETASDVVLKGIAAAAGPILGEIEPGAIVTFEDAGKKTEAST